MNKNDLEQETNLKQSINGDFLCTENKDFSTQHDSTTVDSTRSANADSTVEDAKFNSEEWMDLLDNKEILKKVLYSDTDNSIRVNRGSKVRINLETKIFSTQQVISSECFQNLEVIVGEYGVIHGVDLILPMMYLHERSRVLINPRFGYGSKGKLPDIEPNTRLDCTVEILDIKDDLDDCTIDDKIALAEKRKIRGNFWFAREEYQTAVSCYRKCVEIEYEEAVDSSSLEKVNRLLIDCYNNLALTQLKIDSLSAALEAVDKVISFDANNVKALYRKALILEKRNDLEEAVELLKGAYELEPNNLSVANLLTSLRKRRLIELENEKKLYQKMISNKQKKDTEIDPTPSSPPCQLVSRKFHYTIFGLSAIITLLIAYLVNRYMINYV